MYSVKLIHLVGDTSFANTKPVSAQTLILSSTTPEVQIEPYLFGEPTANNLDKSH